MPNLARSSLRETRAHARGRKVEGGEGEETEIRVRPVVTRSLVMQMPLFLSDPRRSARWIMRGRHCRNFSAPSGSALPREKRPHDSGLLLVIHRSTMRPRGTKSSKSRPVPDRGRARARARDSDFSSATLPLDDDTKGHLAERLPAYVVHEHERNRMKSSSEGS